MICEQCICDFNKNIEMSTQDLKKILWKGNAVISKLICTAILTT